MLHELVSSMALPLCACLVLTGIHVYLGIHVLARKVIFVDLALAQIAAFGAVWGMLLGWSPEEDALVVKGFSLFFTSVGAAVFAFTRVRHERVPHEAIIGITYAVALAATILASAHLAHGAEEMRELLAGSILWVRGETVLVTALLYAAIGTFHFVFRRRFFLISLEPERALEQGVRVRLWDFLFYASFGLVVTSSVAIAGVLLVFSYLVIPAAVAMLFASSVRARLALGWAIGTLVSLIGLGLSWRADLPSGPTIVVAFGAFLALAGVVRYLRSAPRLAPALARALAGAALLAGLVFGSLALEKRVDRGLVPLLASADPSARLMAIAQLRADPAAFESLRAALPSLARDPDARVRKGFLELALERVASDLGPSAEELLLDPDIEVREAALRCVRRLARPESADALLAALELEDDEHLVVEQAEAALELGDPRGVPWLLGVMDDGVLIEARRDAWEHLHAHTRLDFDYHAAADPASETNERELERFRAWWESARAVLSFDARSGVFAPRD